jgi:flagellar protein FliL
VSGRRGIGISSVWSRRLAAALLCLWAAGADASGPAAPGGPTFIKLPPIVLPIFEGNTVTRQASLVLALELAAGRGEDDVEAQRRRLVDGFIADLYSLYEQREHAERVIDPAIIKARLLATADRILGRGIVHDILIQQAFERPRKR